jgi:hypothetical protein
MLAAAVGRVSRTIGPLGFLNRMAGWV